MTQLTTGKQKLNEEQLLNHLAGIYKEMNDQQDTENAKKVRQLMKKLHDAEYSIGFCGHFSAGKSSMINELAGDEILPSSPIPTSANLVKVRSGKELARVYLFNGEVIEFPAPYDIDEVKKYCMDGHEVDWIEISTNSSFIPEGVTILDTPGIDSVDDAHRVATESALHLADIILYMMDYNHVQSEVSFHFTKKLQEMNKPLYLVINQIDKHHESELSFKEFTQGVIDSFRDWGVHPEGIFYTSLRDKNHQNNQFTDLQALLSIKFEGRQDALIEGIERSAQSLIEDHLEKLTSEKYEASEKWLELLKPFTTDELNELTTKVALLKNKIEESKSLVKDAEIWFDHELSKMLNSAYIMPFQTRELARLFLESTQPEFKVGLFFSKQKTDLERKSRLELFHRDLLEKVESQINWHVKELLVGFISKYRLPEELKTEAYELNIVIEESDLQDLVKKGAKVTGDAVLHFTNDVANECKKRYKQAALELVRNWIFILNEKSTQETELMVSDLQKYDQYLEAIDHLNKIKLEIVSFEQKLNHILTTGPKEDITNIKTSIIQSFQTNKILIKTVENQKESIFENLIANENNEEIKEIQISDHVDSIDTKDMVQKLEVVTSSLVHLKGTQTIAKQMLEKANRLKNQAFTIALFGAFSAGKSSFANALMGTKLLPVSPNPTTATINKIKPVTSEFPHGTVRVQIKEREQLEKDLQLSLKFFDVVFSSIPDTLKQIEKILQIAEIEPRQKPHYSFLKAFYHGYQGQQDKIGQMLYVDLEQFEDFVANEEKSCFVEWIEVYYDCPLTRQGITLVDTPGADSINARHTGVAFEYIKNADAILFVTYYNHAFSKADREFLIQLGRVKDAFELDKMFFMINAADLASSTEELLLVKNYVKNQLISYGIRNPRMYPISSQLALKEKAGETIQHSVLTNSGIAQFEDDFKHFIKYELTELTINSARQDLKRVEGIIKDYIETAKIGNDQKEELKNKLKDEHSKIIHSFGTMDISTYERALLKEVKELVYYVKQRLFLRFTDMFNESFHPSMFSDESKNIKKVLVSCLEELVEFLTFDITQELRATNVRIESFLKKQMRKIHELHNEQIKNIHESVEITFIENEKIDTLEFEDLFAGLNYEPLLKSLSIFKNAKSFFENNGKKKLRDDLEVLLQKPVTDTLESCSAEMEKYFLDVFLKQIEKLKGNGVTEVNHYFEGLFDVLSENMDIEELKAIENKVNSIIS